LHAQLDVPVRLAVADKTNPCRFAHHQSAEQGKKNVNRTIAPTTAPTAAGYAATRRGAFIGDILCDNCRPFCRTVCHRFAGPARVAIIFPRPILAFSAEKMSAIALFR
jgi:hypothetical protein